MFKLKLNQQQKLRQWRYALKHDIFNKQNLALVATVIVALIWLSAAVQEINQNRKQQRRLDAKLREAKILELEADNLAFEQDYFRSPEYQDLALRQKTNLVSPGEKVLILGEYSSWVDTKTQELAKQSEVKRDSPEPSNFRKWLDFFFGAKSAQINNLDQ